MLQTKYKTNALMRCKYRSFAIPLGSILTLLLACFLNLKLCENYKVVAIDSGNEGPVTDAGTITAVPAPVVPTPTASLTLSKTKITSGPVKPGEVATASTEVTVSVGNAASYSLNLKVNSTTLKNGSSILNAGNVTTDNTWGYKWDNASSYTAPSTTNVSLTSSSNPTVGTELSNDGAEFTKTLTFGAKFASDAEAGAYSGGGTISLVVTPKAATITLDNLTQMQQLAPGYAPDACKNTIIPSGQDYAGPYTLTDVRDNNTYTVYKFKDGKCWMTQNLKLTNYNVGAMSYPDGRTLIPSTSDVSSTWTLPVSSKTGFSSDTASNTYITNNTGYYTWCAATAGTCSSATSDGANAPSSICPKGWKLPVGYQSTKTDNDFWTLFRSIGLTISNDSLASNSGSYTGWGSGDLAVVQNAPYNFAYTGNMYNNTFYPSSYQTGDWWSRTAYDSTYAYYLRVASGNVGPGTYKFYRRYGYAVRCVAQ